MSRIYQMINKQQAQKDRRTTKRQKAAGVLKDTVFVGLPYALAVACVGWLVLEVMCGG